MAAERIWELMGRKLAEEASEEELQELDQLLRDHPGIHLSVQAITDVWQQAAATMDEQKLANLYDEHKDRMQQKGILLNQPAGEQTGNTAYLLEGARHTNRNRFMWIAAASILLLLAIGGIVSLVQKPAVLPVAKSTLALPGEITTQYGSRTTMQLPDGTRVWLNAGSKLTYAEDFGNALREVSLTGEAFFDVVKNAKKPFVIHTATIDVKVLGTQFNVRSYPADKTTETSLINGSVEVVVKKRPNEKFILKPNEKLVVLNEQAADTTALAKKETAKEPLIAIRKLTYQQGDTTAVEAAWTINKLSFKDEPFIELAQKMERWYDVEFEFRNKRLEDVWITGSLQNETLSQALEALQFCTNTKFSYEIKNNKVIIF